MSDKLDAGRTIEALRRKNLEGKKMFIEELRDQKSLKSVALLLEILCDESWYLRELAIGALVETGEMAREPLRNIFQSGLWYTRAAAAMALGRMGDRPSATGILGLLDEQNRTVREAGITALSRLAENGGAEALVRALFESPYDRAAERLITLRRVNPDLADALEKELEEIRKSPPSKTGSPRASDEHEGGGSAGAP